MADQAPNSKPTAPPGSNNIPEESIIDRKIERRGLPFSFSSSLVRPRVSPPRNRDNNGASSNKSVKSIVNFFETSKSNTPSAISGDGESSKSKPASSRATSTAATSASHSPLHGLANAPDVEDYSLTLLKYRQYFTYHPLARCLDGQLSSEQLSNDNKEATDSPPSPEEDQQLHVPKKRQVAEKDSKTKRSTGSSTIDQPEDSQPLIHRDPQEVAAYWNHIRNFLWISDEELEDAEKSQKNGNSAPRAPFLGAFPSPIDSISSPGLPPPRSLRGNYRTGSDASQRSLEDQIAYLESTQKQVVELDAYLTKKPIDAEPASPASTIPSPLVSPTLAPKDTNPRTLSSETHQSERCTSCCKVRVSYGESSHGGSGYSSQSRPPQRPHLNLSRGNSARIAGPPVLGGDDHEHNFF